MIGSRGGLDEPVRRYLAHAIRDEAAVGSGVRLAMRGRIRVGVWLPFVAEERCEARSFDWRARVGWGRLRPLEVRDGYADGRGRTSGRLFGRATVFEEAGPDTVRSAAGRTALEAAVWAPSGLVGDEEVEWRAEDDDVVVSWPIPPERPDVRLRIDARGALRSAVAERWGDAGRKDFGYVPCGCEVHAERRFGDLVVPSRVTVGWWFGTPRYAPFFEAEITELSQ